MSKNNVIIALVVLCLVGTIWGSVQDKKSESLERQIASMKGQAPATEAVATDGAAVNSGALDAALGKVESLTSQNKKLLAKAATLKGKVSGLKKELKEADGGTEAVAAMQGELDKSAGAIAKLEATVATVKADLGEKITALVVAEEAVAGFENVKNTLANSIDAYSEKSQELTAEVENATLHVTALETALEERTKLLVANGKELARTKLNMNVLLSRIAAQNNSLAILDETRQALELELANKFLIIEEMQHQLGAQIIVDAVVEEKLVEAVVELEEQVVEAEEAAAAPAEEHTPQQ